MAVAVTLPFAAISVFLMRLVLRSRKWKQAAGTEQMLGEWGIAPSGLKSGVEGMIRIHGENWRAVAHQDVSAGGAVEVRKIVGLTLYVEPSKTQGSAKTSA
jgi:membrane-bound ClpP family serine protease